MTPHLVTGAGGRAPNPTARRELPYVLIADRDERRISACIEAIKPHRRGALVAASADEATGILDRFGPPVMLLADILLPPQGGFALIEEVRRIETARTGIVAWAAARALREFALCQLAGLNVRVLGGSAPPSVIRSLVDKMLNAPAASRESAAASSEDALPAVTEETVEWLQAQARDVCGTPGIAVYMRDGTGNSFRSSGSWTPDEPIPQSLDYLPYALNRVMETREPFVALDVMADPAGHAVEERGFGGLRGLVAVPVITGGQEVAGMICAFDVKPLSLEPRQIQALTALGRLGVAAPPAPSKVEDLAARRSQGPARIIADGRLRQKVVLLDRDAGAAAADREIARVRRYQHPLSVVVFDINRGRSGGASSSPPDAPGAPATPGPVDALSQTLARMIRGSDLAIRWSGEEFVLVLPGVGTSEARRVADRVHKAVRSGVGDRVALLDGVAELGNDSWESLLARAGSNKRDPLQAPVNGTE